MIIQYVCISGIWYSLIIAALRNDITLPINLHPRTYLVPPLSPETDDLLLECNITLLIIMVIHPKLYGDTSSLISLPHLDMSSKNTFPSNHVPWIFLLQVLSSICLISSCKTWSPQMSPCGTLEVVYITYHHHHLPIYLFLTHMGHMDSGRNRHFLGLPWGLGQIKLCWSTIHINTYSTLCTVVPSHPSISWHNYDAALGKGSPTFLPVILLISWSRPHPTLCACMPLYGGHIYYFMCIYGWCNHYVLQRHGW